MTIVQSERLEPAQAMIPSAEAPDLMVVMDHHQAKIYRVEPLSRGAAVLVP